ncbi:MAG: EamA family transporter, partial [Calditrichaeota bacterium]|nr:EamA family transporter [Calditrichota bacterium]
VAIDRLSIAFVVLLAALFLGEPASLRVLLGTGLIIAGALMISL